MANPRKFSEKIALHNQKQAEETAAFEQIMREVSDATNKVHSSTRHASYKAPKPVETVESTLRLAPQGLGTFRSGSLPNVAAPQATNAEPETIQPEETTLATQYGLGSGVRSGAASPSRSPGQRGRASSSVGPMRRPADRKHDTSPYGSTVYLSPPLDSNWRRTNSDSALHQSCGGAAVGAGEPPTGAPPLSPHHPLYSHAHPRPMLHSHQTHHRGTGAPPLSLHHPLHSHAHPRPLLHSHQNHRRAADIPLDAVLLGMNPNNRPRSSCEIPRIPNNNNVYESAGPGGVVASAAGGLVCGELQVPGGSLPDLTSVHFPPPHYARHPHHPHHTPTHQQHPHHQQQPPDYHQTRYSPTSPGAVSPGGGSVSPATGGLSPASGSPVGATVPLNPAMHHSHDHSALYDAQNHLSVPNTNNYPHHNKNMSPLDHSWITSGYQSHCSPPSQYSSSSNINIPSPTMVHSPGSPAAESPQTDYSNLHQLLQPFEQITMLDSPVSSYSTSYMNHNSPLSPQTTSSQHTTQHTYPQSSHTSAGSADCGAVGTGGAARARDPVPGGGGFPPLQPLASPAAPRTPATPASIPDIILTDYSGELDAGIFGVEEASLRAGIDLDDLTMLDEPAALLPDSAVEHEFRHNHL